MRSADGIPLQEAIQQMKRSSPYKHKLEEATLACAWKTVMPPSVSQRTERTFLKQGKLFVRLSSAPLRQEFQLNKDKVLALLQSHAQGCGLTEVVFL
ncbi:MAG: DUF721 domain-containing protein [Roseivirga sp.]